MTDDPRRIKALGRLAKTFGLIAARDKSRAIAATMEARRARTESAELVSRLAGDPSIALRFLGESVHAMVKLEETAIRCESAAAMAAQAWRRSEQLASVLMASCAGAKQHLRGLEERRTLEELSGVARPEDDAS